MTVIDNIKVGERIKYIRNNLSQKKLTQTEFGNLLNPPVKKSSVRNWESGDNLPNSDRLKQIAALANVTTDFLLFGKEKNGYGEKIEKIRQLNNFSKAVLAGRLGVDVKTIEDFENENAFPTKTQFEILADLGETSIDEILWDITIPLKEYFEATQLSIMDNLNENEQSYSEIFFLMVDTLRQVQVGDDEYKVIFDKISGIISSLLYLANTGPDGIYPNNYEQLEKKLNESVEKINEYSLEIKELVLKKRIKK